MSLRVSTFGFALRSGMVSLLILGVSGSLLAQWPLSSGPTQFELSDSMRVEGATAAQLAQLERARTQLHNRQWDEGVETFRHLAAGAGQGLIEVSSGRFVNLSDYCQSELCRLPREALRLYRERVDPLARKWYDDGVALRDSKLLRRVIDEARASSWSNQAETSLAEIALEEGDFDTARWHWQQVLLRLSECGSSDVSSSSAAVGLDPTGVRARIALSSILRGDAQRARNELEQLAKSDPTPRGKLGGREVQWVSALRSLLTESASCPKPKPSPDWPTFAGATERMKICAATTASGQVAWRLTMPVTQPPLRSFTASYTNGPGGVLSYYPVAVGDLVLFNTDSEIHAVRAVDGKPAWSEQSSLIYHEPAPRATTGAPRASEVFGAPVFTMTVVGDRLFARMGAMATMPAQQQPTPPGRSRLVCVSLSAEGRLDWQVEAEDDWLFSGPPVADESNVYVAMRRNPALPEAHVACFDAATGRMRWRRFVCAAETPARGMFGELNNDLLTLHRDVIYYNTNLGGVAGIRADDGRIRWLTRYPRVLNGDLKRLAPHWSREPAACVYHRGCVYVAPADSPRVFAFGAGDGRLLWQTGDELANATCLLGVLDDCLMASGARLYWIELAGKHAGGVRHAWPQTAEQRSEGRGLLVEDGVLWPTRDRLYLLDATTAKPVHTSDLKALGVTGGNLLGASGRLLIATGRELITLRNH